MDEGDEDLLPMVDKLEAKAMSKSDKIEKYEFWGLVLFVESHCPGQEPDRIPDRSPPGVKFREGIPGSYFGYLHSDCHYVVHILCNPWRSPGDRIESFENIKEKALGLLFGE